MLQTIRRNRARVARKVKNHTQSLFKIGDKVRVWNIKSKKYDEEATVTDLEVGDDGRARSYIVLYNDGRQKHLHGNWLLLNETVTQQEANEVQGL